MTKKPSVEVLENEAPTASAQILTDDNRIEYEIDKRGRRIGVKRLKFIDVHRISKIIGGETASNQTAFLQVLAVVSVVEIDGDMVPKPGTNLQIEALMTRLDFAGVEAASKALERLVGDSPSSDNEIKN